MDYAGVATFNGILGIPPLSLAGFSATVSQVLPSGAVVTKPLPFLAVSQVNNCSGTSPSQECVITQLTVQIPVDLWVDWGSSGALGATTTVAVAIAGTVSRSFNVALLPQNFHIVTTCDTGLPNPVQAFFPVACSYAVTHPSGELVTQLNPAKPGEELLNGQSACCAHRDDARADSAHAAGGLPASRESSGFSRKSNGKL